MQGIQAPPAAAIAPPSAVAQPPFVAQARAVAQPPVVQPPPVIQQPPVAQQPPIAQPPAIVQPPPTAQPPTSVGDGPQSATSIFDRMRGRTPASWAGVPNLSQGPAGVRPQMPPRYAAQAAAATPYAAQAPAPTPYAAQAPAPMPYAAQAPAPTTYAAQAPAPMPYAAQAPAEAPNPAGAPQLDGEMVAQVLQEFVETDFCKKICEYCNVGPTAYGQITGIFQSVRLVDNRLVVKLERSVEQRSEKLLDKLAKHLRARLPLIKRLEYETRSPPSTKTIMI